MIFKSDKQISDFIEDVLAKGFRNKGVAFSKAKKTKDVVLMKLSKTPIYYMYGWNSDDDYWVFSDN